MRAWLVVVVLLSVLASPILTQTSILEESEDNLRYSSPIQATISPSSGLTAGGEEITITGSGFLDMAWKNLTSDGNAYTWTTTTANYVYYSGWDPSIGVDSNGTVHIAHSNMDSDDFWLSSYDGSTWTHLKIRNCGTCSNADLVIDSNDNIHIAYYHDISGTGYLLYTMYDGTSWSNNWSTSNAENDQISIALDANDRPHISYSRDGFICNAALLTYYDGSSWTTITLDDTTTYVGCDSSIAIDSNGFVHVAYRHHGNMDMKIASNISGSWQRYLVDNGNSVGYHSAMAVDSNDELHLVYASNSAGNTAYFADGASGSAWTVSNQGNSRDTFSMYIDQFDIVHISEYNGDSNLGYSMMAPGGPRQSMTVDNLGNVGYGNDIVVDENNMIHIAYYDTSNKLLKYANRSTGMSISQEITVQFGNHGYVTGQVVNDTTIVVSNPSSSSAGDAALSLIDKDGNSHNLNVNFTYIDPNDTDSDGVPNASDDCPNTSGNSSIGLVGCPDTDGDGYSDSSENCPYIAGTSTLGEVGCPDSDGDGYSDSTDEFPNDASEHIDSDGDGVGDNADQFPNNANETVDTDGDGVGDNSDWAPSDPAESVDSDGDGVGDNADAFPDDATETTDTDGDGIGDNSDPFPSDPSEGSDSDGDGVGDNADAFPDDATETTDTDGDGVGDNSDWAPTDPAESADSDGDGVGDNGDAFPNNPIETLDSDGDGVGDNSDAFPQDATETMDLDGDGVGDNSDAFPLDANETIDIDGDGVGDNSDAFPNNPLESEDSDGDGIGNNGDPFPYLNNFVDSDLDNYLDILDAFPYNPTQWSDLDGDGYGDNPNGTTPDAFVTITTQWSDLDGDGYGDNWGDSAWNDSRSPLLPGEFISGANQPDFCPEIFGTSIADGFFGCLDSDGDDIADVLQSGGNGQNGSIIGIDTDLDGILDVFDLCSNTPLDVTVGIDGCEIDLGAEAGDSGDSEEEDDFFESFFSGDDETVTKTVGIGAILLAIFALLQTNAIAGLLPETFRWVKILRRNNYLTREERNELTYLQSVIQAYHAEPTTLQSELKTLRGDLTARYTNNEIKKETREKLLVLIDDIMNSSHEQLLDIAYNDAYFGLIGTLDALERGELLDQELAMNATEDEQKQSEEPSHYSLGKLDDKGTYWLEWPENSGTLYYRYTPEDAWLIYEN